MKDRWQATLSYSKLKEKYPHYLPSENATLKVPLTNPEIWSRMSNHLRTSDLSFINIQRNIEKATIAISQVADQILQKNDQLDVKSVVHTSLDAVALLEYTTNKLSVQRRTNIRPALSEDHRGLCKLEFPGSDYLFGQGLAEIMVQATEMNDISKRFSRNLQTFTSKGFPVITNMKMLNKRVTKRRSDSFFGKISNIKTGHQEKEKQDSN